MKKSVWIIRHGETELNALNIVQGQGINAPLNQKGKDQAHLFWEHYKDTAFDLILYSDLIRSQQSVSNFLTSGIQTSQLNDLKEINWGINEGLPPSPMVLQRFNETQQAWLQGDFDARVEGGESARELAQRAANCINYLNKVNRNEILVCSHGRTIRALVCLLLGKSLVAMEEFHHANLGLYKFESDGTKWHCSLMNDTRHLK